MKSRTCAFLAVLVAASMSLAAQNLKIAVMDFSLESDNPQYKYLGKGFTELVSVEVARLPGFILVDRERRNAILEELEFALSGAADAADAMKIGQLLSVEYFVVGSIIDMMGNLVVSYSIVRTDTGAVVGKQAAEGSPKDYKRIVKAISLGIATMAGRESAIAKAQAAPPVSAPVARQEEVLTSFSDAVAALDANDLKTATAKLNVAKSIDPSDNAVRYYLDKLAVGTSKFTVAPDFQYNLNNPANLAFIPQDSVYSASSFSNTNWLTGKPLKGNWVPLAGTYLGKSFYSGEAYYGLILGYSLPVGKSAGVGLQLAYSTKNQGLRVSTNPPDNNSANFAIMAYSGLFSFGWSPWPWLSLGLGGGGGLGVDTDTPPPDLSQAFYGGEFGFLCKNAGGNLMLSYVIAYGTTSFRRFDMDLVAAGSTTLPGELLDPYVHMDLTGTFGFNQYRDFAVLKLIGDIYGLSGAESATGTADFLQIIPAYEHWFGKMLSLRLGGIVSIVPLDTLYVGYGGTLGATLVLGSWDLDFGLTYRNRPNYSANSEIVAEPVINVGIRRNGLFAARK